MHFVRPSRVSGAWENVLSHLALQPFRCQLCAYRFFAFTKGDVERKGDKREYLRIPTRFPVAFSGEQVKGTGTLLNLSIRGCGMESGIHHVRGSTLSLSLQPEEHRPPVQIDVAVVRSIKGKMIGLEFVKIHPGDEERLRRIFYRQATAHPSN
jgi:hypothetical protein